MSDIKILKAHPYYDIFSGNGWSNHTRVKRIKTPTGIIYKHIAGIPIHNKKLQQLFKEQV